MKAIVESQAALACLAIPMNIKNQSITPFLSYTQFSKGCPDSLRDVSMNMGADERFGAVSAKLFKRVCVRAYV